MAVCEPRNRQVSVFLQKGNWNYTRILDAVLYKAVQFAWSACPDYFMQFGERRGLRYSIREVRLYYNGVPVFMAGQLCCDEGIWPSHTYYRWDRTVNLAAQAERQRQQEIANAASQRGVQAQFDQANAVVETAGTVILAIIDLAVLGAIALGLYLISGPIIRGYYFMFHPHPAESMVRAAIAEGAAPMNGRALADALGDVSSGNRFLRRVRLEQGERLVSLMRDAAQERVRKMERETIREYERAALLGIQEAIALAAVALERAKAAYAAGQRIRRQEI